MQTLTFTQKLLRQRSYLSSLIPLLALFLGLGSTQTASAQAAYDTDYVTINATPITPAPSPITTYAGNANGNPPFFQGADLGNGAQFDQATGASALTLTAASANLQVFARTAVPSSRFFYRVYLQGTAPATKPDYTLVSLMQTSLTNSSSPVSYGNSGLNIDLLHQPGVLGGGTYVVEVKFESTVNRTNTATPPTTSTTLLTDDNGGGNGFQAIFSVIAPSVTPPGGTTTWISTTTSANGTNWRNVANWTNGVPTRNANAVFPAKDDLAHPNTTYALLNDPSTPYDVQTLTLQGTTNSTRAVVRVGQSIDLGPVLGASLRVYGDLVNTAGGLLAGTISSIGSGNADPALNSTVIFAGDAATVSFVNGVSTPTGGVQNIYGNTVIADVSIQGIGVKKVYNSLNILNTITFAPNVNALVRSVDVNGNLNTTKTSFVDLKTSGTLAGETNTAYIDGTTLADRPLTAGTPEGFGNIGIDITPDRSIPSNTSITRTIGDPFKGPLGNGAMGIKRQYGITGDVNTNTTSTIVFHYLATTNELNGNPEPNLVIFRTADNGAHFSLIGGTLNTGLKTVTYAGIRSINTITLGNRLLPLPVTLTSFEAKRAGSDAILTWTTATETDNKGYNVQVSTNGKEFRTLGFVTSTSPNSVSPTKYNFTDIEKNKIGIRYYRLEQVDTDGKLSYFAPRAVSFSDESTAGNAAVVAYPNPFDSEVYLNLQSSQEGKALVRITDMTGRLVGQRQVLLTVGNNDFEVANLGDLKAGIYLMRVTLPSGDMKSLKVVK